MLPSVHFMVARALATGWRVTMMKKLRGRSLSSRRMRKRLLGVFSISTGLVMSQCADHSDKSPRALSGVFKGEASSELTVAVRVAPSDKPPPPETEMESEDWSAVLQEDPAQMDREAAEQQQQ